MESKYVEDTNVIKKINELCENKLDDDFISDLKFLNNIKFKYYEQFAPGLNFFDSLFLWLKNFEKEERKEALNILKCLIFFSREEMKILSHQIFREKIKKYLLKTIIKENEELNIFDYNGAYKYYIEYLNESLFIALSDGAMIDYFRRQNIENNDQIVSYYKLHLDAQFEIAFKNFEERKKPYRFFFLIEDFVASGTTFLRDENNINFWLNEDNINELNNHDYIDNLNNKHLQKPNLKGQLIRFLNYWSHLINLNKNYKIIYCPYVMTSFSKDRINAMLKYYGSLNYIQNFEKIKILPQLIIPNELRAVKCCSSSGLRNIKLKDALNIEYLCKKYYNKIEKHLTPSQRLGGGLQFGFGQRGLSIVRYNNVPNNSIYLIWFSEGWNPIFPRFKRHKN